MCNHTCHPILILHPNICWLSTLQHLSISAYLITQIWLSLISFAITFAMLSFQFLDHLFAQEVWGFLSKSNNRFKLEK